MKKILLLFTTLLLLVGLHVTGNVPSVTAATGMTTDVELSVTYGQTAAREMLSLINQFRTGDETWYWNETDSEKIWVNDLKPLEYSYELEKIAMQRAAEIALNFSHTRPNGQSTFSLGSFYGENIAAGYGSASSVMEGWKETNYYYSGQGHRRNMLSSRFTHVGIGHVYVNGTHYWVQDFGVGSSVGSSTAANDSLMIIVVEVADNYVRSFTLTDNAVSLAVNESKSVASQTGTLTMTDSWPTGAPVTVKPAWTVADSSIASLQNGVLTGVATGTTTLRATLFGKSAQLSVNVSCANHTWGEWKTTKAADCAHDGARSRTCMICGETVSETVKALGHTYQDTVIAATCTEQGYTTHTCVRCGDSYKDSYTAITTHTWGDWAVTKEATCIQTGTQTRVCSVCGETETETAALTEHNYVNGECTVCGAADPNPSVTEETEPSESEETEPDVTEPDETLPTAAEITEPTFDDTTSYENEPTIGDTNQGQRKGGSLVWLMVVAGIVFVGAVTTGVVVFIKVRRKNEM